MAIPNVDLHVQDGGLGVVPPGAGDVLVVIGCSSSGTANQPLSSTQPGDFITGAGYGPGPELAAFITDQTGNQVIFVKAATQTSGTNTAVILGSSNTSSSAVTLSGNPYDSGYWVLTVSTGGTIGTNGIIFTLSNDDGRTIYTTVNLGTATSYVIPNTGITVNFGAGTLVADDTFSWVSTEPLWSDAYVASAIQSLYGISDVFRDIVVVGGATSTVGGPGAAAADATAFDGYMTSLFNKQKYARLLCNARDAAWGGTSNENEQQWMGSLSADFVNVSSLRVGVTAGHYNAISAVSQTQPRRPLLFQAAARDSLVALQIALSRVSDGPLPRTVIPSTPDGFIYHNEAQNPGLDASRFTTARKFNGRPGFYITNPNLMSPPGSDFDRLQIGHVIDAACIVADAFFTGELGSSVRIDSDTGFILEQDAKNLEARCNAQLSAVLINNQAASSATCTLSRTDPILSTKTLHATISVVPLGYLETIDVTVQLVNPAANQAAA